MMKGTLLRAGWILIGITIWGQALLGAASPQKATPANQTREVISLKIDGWTCASCEKEIRRALLVVPGVTCVDVSYARGGAVVEIESGRVSHDQLVQAVANAGNILSAYRATVVPNGTLMGRAAEQDGGWNGLWNLFK